MGWVDPWVGLGWVGLVVGREFLFLVGWFGSWVWNGRFAKNRCCVAYITTLSICNFALGSNNAALWKFAVWRITASSLFWGWVGYGLGWSWVHKFTWQCVGLSWVWVDEMDIGHTDNSEIHYQLTMSIWKARCFWTRKQRVVARRPRLDAIIKQCRCAWAVIATL